MSAAKTERELKPDPRQVRAARRLWFKERVYESRALQKVYASVASARASASLRRGRPYEAADTLMRAWRHLGSEGLGARKVERVRALVREYCYDAEGQLRPASENRLRLDFVRTEKARELRRLYGAFPEEHRVRLRFPRPDPDPERQGDLAVLKSYDASTGERGVLMVMYGEAMLAMAAVYDLGALASRYQIVLEPSSWGYQEAKLFTYLGSDLDVLVQSPRRADFEFVESLSTNLSPTRVGAGEWVDPSTFKPRDAGVEAKYDVVMVAAWDPLKRHEVFFHAASKLRRERGRELKFALIGYPMGWGRGQVESLLRRYGLERDCEIYELIPHGEVARVVADSKVSLLLSRQEGANRGIYEGMFCGTPVIVYKQQCGVNLDHVNARTGLLAEDEELADAITHVLEHPEEFDPREWALEHVGYSNATRTINAALRDMAARRGLPWTRDIVAKKNAPNLRYAEPGIYKKFDAEYESLREFLLPLD